MDAKKAKKAAKLATGATAWTVGSVVRLVIRTLATVLLIVLTTGLLFTCVFAFYVKNSLSIDMEVSMDDFRVALTSTIYYKDSTGNYKELEKLYSKENRVWVDYERIPQYMEYAVVAIEDKRFYEHKGVDWYRTAGAFSNMFLSMSSSYGGSTLTQQLIKNLTKEDEVTVQRKLLEIFRALDFEKTYTKEEIVEWYLNAVYFGQGCYGIATAAQTYFGKDAWELSLAECASIAGITNAPTKYDPFYSKSNNKERQETILHEMYDQGYISFYEYDQAVNEKLVFKRAESESYVQEIRSWYVDTIIQDILWDLQEKKGYSENVAEQLLYQGGLQIYACVDMEIQNYVNSIYENPAEIPKAANYSAQQLQSAIVIVDPYNGDIVALSGGVGEKTGNLVFNRATDAKRPPGSSIKPIAVYAPALERGLITQPTTVDDSPAVQVGTNPVGWPRNSGGGNRGVVTIRQAVVSSINTVSAQVLEKLGLDVSYQFLTENLGVTKSLVVSRDGQTDIAYAPLALGQLTDGITVREMAQAYSAFVNDGVFTYSRTYSHILDADGNMFYDNTSEQIVAMRPNTAWNMTDMLVAAVSGGTGKDAYFSSVPVAGKTGTTTDNHDRYFVGYTPYYVAAVWTGYDIGERMNFSYNPAAVIWKKIMQPVHEMKGCEWKSFPTPTIGSPTNIFGKLEEEEEEESPSPSPSESPSPSPSESPSTPPTETTPQPSTPQPSTPQPSTQPPASTPVTVTDPPSVVTDPPPIVDPVT